MMTIDSDAHVHRVRTDLDVRRRGRRDLMPRLVSERDGNGAAKTYWMFEGRVHGQTNVGANTPKESRELADVEARLRHMDELEIDVQVLYPTVFLRPLTSRPEVELALARATTAGWRTSGATARTACAGPRCMPTMSMDATVRELRWAREHGACAAFTCGIVRRHDSTTRTSIRSMRRCPSSTCRSASTRATTASCGRTCSRPRAATRGPSWRWSARSTRWPYGVPTRFPKLRIGFIEAASQWMPGTVHDIARRMEKRTGQPFDRYGMLRENRLYVTCQTDDDLPYVLKYAGRQQPRHRHRLRPQRHGDRDRGAALLQDTGRGDGRRHREDPGRQRSGPLRAVRTGGASLPLPWRERVGERGKRWVLSAASATSTSASPTRNARSASTRKRWDWRSPRRTRSTAACS